MKKIIILATAVALIVPNLVFAQESIAPDFSVADANADGILNTKEANVALPALGLDDENRDGIISKSDVKRALPSIDFSNDDESAIGPMEYQKIVQVMRKMLENA
ncbi:MAG: hypothetical protein R3332_11600 [Pseudohongiellaceae bacterium]|nr:hypothetical protein [Pseudohongiellaceae bacterium]